MSILKHCCVSPTEGKTKELGIVFSRMELTIMMCLGVQEVIDNLECVMDLMRREINVVPSCLAALITLASITLCMQSFEQMMLWQSLQIRSKMDAFVLLIPAECRCILAGLEGSCCRLVDLNQLLLGDVKSFHLLQ